MIDTSLPSADEIRSLLAYDPETGILTWKARKTEGLTGCALNCARIFNTRYAGSTAGTIRPDGYITVMRHGRPYSAHRLAWLITTGQWPVDQIDHANGRRADNRFRNLREADYEKNGQSQKARENSTGFPGVSRNGSGFRAQIQFRGKFYYLGTFTTPELARAAYLAGAKDLGFDEFHGCTAAERAARPLPDVVELAGRPQSGLC